MAQKKARVFYEEHRLPISNDVNERFEAVCAAGAARHGGLWLHGNQAAVSAAQGLGVHMEKPAMKRMLVEVVLRVLDKAKHHYEPE